MEGVRDRLLKCLDQHEFRTGTEIGAALGLSRAAIHKHVSALVDRGVPIHRVPGRGYRLSDGVALLDAAVIVAGLSGRARALVAHMDVLQEVDSTSAELQRNAVSGSIDGWVCLAEKQTAGRGRRGRTWVASPYRDLVMSTAVEYRQWPPDLPALGLVTGLCLIKALAQLGVPGLMLKWPNDIVHGLRKLAGILLDVSGEAHGTCRVVVGVGLNVSMDLDLAPNIGQRWVDLETVAGRSLDRNVVAARCLSELMPTLESFPADGFSVYRDQWRRLDALKGCAVRIHSADGTVLEGEAAGVDDSGRLRVVDAGGAARVFTQGEVSVRMR